MMRGIAVFSIMVVGILAMAGLGIGLSYTKYDTVSTNLSIEEGITCTIDGKEVNNGDKISSKYDFGRMKIHVESTFDQKIGYKGIWTNGSDVYTSKESNGVVNSGDFTIDFKHGEFKGYLRIQFLSEDGVAPITFNFDIGEGIVVKEGDNVVSGTYTIWNSTKLTVTATDGNPHTFKYEGRWWDSYGDHVEVSKEVKDVTTFEITITDSFDYPPAHGRMTIKIVS